MKPAEACWTLSSQHRADQLYSAAGVCTFKDEETTEAAREEYRKLAGNVGSFIRSPGMAKARKYGRRTSALFTTRFAIRARKRKSTNFAQDAGCRCQPARPDSKKRSSTICSPNASATDKKVSALLTVEDEDAAREAKPT